MGLKSHGRDIECVEVYPHTNDSGHIDMWTFALVDRTGRSVVVDQVYRRDNQTVLDSMHELVRMIRHVTADSF